MRRKRFIPSQRVKGSGREVFIVNYEGSVLEFQRTSNLYEPLVIRLDGEVLDTIPSKQNKEIDFSTAEGKHKLQVWNERVENSLIPKVFVKDGIAIVIDSVPVQNSLADPITRMNSGKAIIWLLTILLFIKGFIIPLSFIQDFKETLNLIILFVYIILFILSLSAALTYRLNPLRSTWIGLVLIIIESAEYFYSIILTREFSILTILFAVLRLSILGSLIFSLRNLKHILSYDQDTIPISLPTDIPNNKKIRKRFSFPTKYVIISILSLIIVAGIYYGISEYVRKSNTPSIERDINLEFRTDLKLPDLIPYRKGDKWGYCNKEGKIIISPKYSKVNIVWKDVNRLIVNYNGLEGVIDYNGNKIIPFIYDELTYYSDKNIYEAKRGKYGVIDEDENIIIPFKYDDIYISDSYILAEKNVDGINIQQILKFFNKKS